MMPVQPNFNNQEVDFNQEILPNDKLKYMEVFKNNVVSFTVPKKMTADIAKKLLQKYNLPKNELAKIWSLSDIDSDGHLTENEFILAMHLCETRLSGGPIPTFVSYTLKQSATPSNFYATKSKKDNLIPIQKPQTARISQNSLKDFTPNYEISPINTPNANLMGSANVDLIKMNNNEKTQRLLIDLASDLQKEKSSLLNAKLIENFDIFQQLESQIMNHTTPLAQKIEYFYFTFEEIHKMLIKNPAFIYNPNHFKKFMADSYNKLVEIDTEFVKNSSKTTIGSDLVNQRIKYVFFLIFI